MKDKSEPKGIYRNLTSYGDREFSKYMRRAFLASAGYDEIDLDRPIIGIADTSSDYNTCHRGMQEMVQAVKRGVLESGGLPFAFPTCSLNEIFMHPTTMLYRNLMAMETEEMIRSQPMDAVVLLGGCDKTVPAQIMAAVSADVPAVVTVTGPMMTGDWRGARLGACTDCRKYWSLFRAGKITKEEIKEIEKSLCSNNGTCMVMGTASTMACLAETLGLMLPGGASPPSGSGARLRNAVASGRTAVTLAGTKLRPRDIISEDSFVNALTVLTALGGSTNAVIHLIAIARRAGIDISLDDLNRISEQTPLLVNCKPAGENYMEDFHKAGGMPVLLKSLEPLLRKNVLSVSGKTLGETLLHTEAPGDWQNIIRTLDNPLGPAGSLTVLRGNLAPDGAVIKTAAASPELLKHTGPAAVFESPEDVAERIDDPDLRITPEHVLVMRNAGPVGAGMPEAGYLPIPTYLAEKGVTDMVRISDARMSGTAFGTIVLHCSPEAAVGGTLALVENDDLIRLDVRKKRIELLIDESELKRRRALFKPGPRPSRGWKKLYADRVLQAHLGADLDFL